MKKSARKFQLLPVAPEDCATLWNMQRRFWQSEAKKEAERIAKKQDKIVFDYIAKNPKCYTRPSDMLLDGGGSVVVGSDPLMPKSFWVADVAQAFLAFPRAMPTELKGVAV